MKEGNLPLTGLRQANFALSTFLLGTPRYY
jgi:hypothetical protein